MVNWETLEIIPTQLGKFYTIFTMIIVNIAIIYIIEFYANEWFKIFDIRKYPKTKAEEETGQISEVRKKRRKSQTVIIAIIFLLVGNLGITKLLKNVCYTIKVEVSSIDISTQDLEKIKIKENIFSDFNLARIHGTQTTYYPLKTKLNVEKGNIYFTTAVPRSYYQAYKTPETFKEDIEKLVKSTIANTKEQIATRPEIMAKFTQEHLKSKGK